MKFMPNKDIISTKKSQKNRRKREEEEVTIFPVQHFVRWIKT